MVGQTRESLGDRLFLLPGPAGLVSRRSKVDYDALIVGGGHNGLVASFYLARAGFKVAVLERNDKVGGECVTDEIFPGFQFSTCAHSFVIFHPAIVDDMRLVDHGVEIIPRDPDRFQPFLNGKHVVFWQDRERTLDSIGRISKADARAFARWEEFWARAGAIFEPYLLTKPPTLGEFMRRWEGGPDEEICNRLVTGSTRGILEECFESPEIRAAFSSSFDAGFTDASGGLLYWAFHRSLSRQLAERRLVGYPKGGMGAVARALCKSAEAAGAEINTRLGAAKMLMRNGRVCGVITDDGREIGANAVLSTIDPRTTLLGLVGAERLPLGIAARAERIHAHAGYMKLHCAANGLPDWKAIPGTHLQPHHLGQARICSSLDVLDTAWNASRHGQIADEFAMAVVNPALYDTFAAPKGRYAISVWVELVPIRPYGQSWDNFREEMTARVIKQVAIYAPNFPDIIERSYLHTPEDIERRVGAFHGSMHHIDMTIDQMLALRPLAGWSGYRTPIPGLYLGGSGSHPGGGVTGIPGRNAAKVALADLA